MLMYEGYWTRLQGVSDARRNDYSRPCCIVSQESYAANAILSFGKEVTFGWPPARSKVERKFFFFFDKL